jgi:hypothetical protein
METQHVFLDTEFFVSRNFHFESPTFQRIIELVEQGKIYVHLTSITIGEIERRIVSSITEGIIHLKVLQKDERTVRVVGFLPNSPFRFIDKKFDVEGLQREAIEAFHEFLRRVKVDVIPVEGLSVDEVFDKYFKSVPPFGSAEKKHEFPDAFAIAGVQRWCDTNGQKIYVVSNDTDMKQACDQSVELVSLPSIHELFNIVAQEAKLYAYAARVYEQYKQEILVELKERFSELWFFLDEAESDVSDVEVKEIDIIKEMAIEVEEDHATFRITADITYSAGILYAQMVVEDVPVSWVEGEIEETERIHAEVSILYDRQDPDASQVDSVTIEEESIMVGTEPAPWELK